jgi:Raf kinase inhibitor-like YbhB/YbcL family protein
VAGLSAGPGGRDGTRMLHARTPTLTALLIGLGLAGLACSVSKGGPSNAAGKLAVTSAALHPDQPIPAPYACADDEHLGKSPPLAWSPGPPGTVAYAITIVDPDAKGFVHWAVVDLPATATSLPEGASGALPAGAVELPNDFDKPGYGGPCPPPGAPHHYVIVVRALDTRLRVEKADAAFFQRLDASTLASGSLTATYQRGK